jgi:hypothetical protein
MGRGHSDRGEVAAGLDFQADSTRARKQVGYGAELCIVDCESLRKPSHELVLPRRRTTGGAM